jgi:hypothetical protein
LLVKDKQRNKKSGLASQSLSFEIPSSGTALPKDH